MLNLPDIRQTTDYDCGAAAIDTVCRFYKRRERGPVKLANHVQGMAPDTVEAVFRSLGFKLLSGTMTTRDLRSLALDRPVMCCINAETGGHWVTIRGVTRARVHFQCPVLGPTTLSIEHWEGIWHDRTSSGHHYDHYGLCAYLG